MEGCEDGILCSGLGRSSSRVTKSAEAEEFAWLLRVRRCDCLGQVKDMVQEHKGISFFFIVRVAVS